MQLSLVHPFASSQSNLDRQQLYPSSTPLSLIFFSLYLAFFLLLLFLRLKLASLALSTSLSLSLILFLFPPQREQSLLATRHFLVLHLSLISSLLVSTLLSSLQSHPCESRQ